MAKQATVQLRCKRKPRQYAGVRNPDPPADAFQMPPYRVYINPPANTCLLNRGFHRLYIGYGRTEIGLSPLHRVWLHERCRRATPWPLFLGSSGRIRCRLMVVSRATISKCCCLKTSVGRPGISGRHRQAWRGPGCKRPEKTQQAKTEATAFRSGNHTTEDLHSH